VHSDRARAEVGDACDLASRFQDAAGVFSLFGLQQLPQPHLTLANWVTTLAPGQLTPGLHAMSAVLSALAITLHFADVCYLGQCSPLSCMLHC